jgi:hypothetical protein
VIGTLTGHERYECEEGDASSCWSIDVGTKEYPAATQVGELLFSEYFKKRHRYLPHVSVEVCDRNMPAWKAGVAFLSPGYCLVGVNLSLPADA